MMPYVVIFCGLCVIAIAWVIWCGFMLRDVYKRKQAMFDEWDAAEAND